MKYYLEEENEIDLGGELVKSINKVKEVKDKDEAKALKKLDKKYFFHVCYHDEDKPRPCTREEI